MLIIVFFTLVASSLSFMDSCNFELENICGMTQSSGDSVDWQQVSQAPGGPENDHSNMGQCQGKRRENLPHILITGLTFAFATIDLDLIAHFFQSLMIFF